MEKEMRVHIWSGYNVQAKEEERIIHESGIVFYSAMYNWSLVSEYAC